MLLSPVVRLIPAFAPNAMLPLPVMLNRANAPLAVLLMPVELSSRAATPTAVLSAPVIFNKSAAVPTAVLLSAAVEVKRSSANGGVGVASGDAKQRKITNCRVRSARGETLKGLVPRSSGEVGIAPRGWRVDRFRFRQKSEAEKRQCDEKWWSCFELN